jgi:hypothetical protein
MIKGKLIEVSAPITGEGKKGTWKKQLFIFETDDKYPKTVSVINWNDKVDPGKLEIGKEYTVGVNIESRNYKNQWYTDVTMWMAEPVSATPPASLPESKDQNFEPIDESEDLPF